MPMIELAYFAPAADAGLPRRLAALAAELTARHLKKDPSVTTVALRAVGAGGWFVAGAPLEDRAGYHLTTTVTAGTNLKSEMDAYLAAVHAALGQALGPVSEHSYAQVQEVAAHGYGYGGRTQERRYVETRPSPA